MIGAPYVYSGLKLSCFTQVVSWRAVSILFTAIWTLFPIGLPPPSWTDDLEEEAEPQNPTANLGHTLLYIRKPVLGDGRSYCYQLSLASQSGVEPCESSSIAEILTTFILCRSCVSSHSCWESMSVVAYRVQKTLFSAVFHPHLQYSLSLVGNVMEVFHWGWSLHSHLPSALWSFGVQCVALWSMQKEASAERWRWY